MILKANEISLTFGLLGFFKRGQSWQPPYFYPHRFTLSMMGNLSIVGNVRLVGGGTNDSRWEKKKDF